MGTIQFEKINGGVPYTTYFYKKADVALVNDTEYTGLRDIAGVPMWSGQTVDSELGIQVAVSGSDIVTNIRSVEVYQDNENISDIEDVQYGVAGLAKFKYLGIKPYPTGSDIDSGTVYVRIHFLEAGDPEIGALVNGVALEVNDYVLRAKVKTIPSGITHYTFVVVTD